MYVYLFKVKKDLLGKINVMLNLFDVLTLCSKFNKKSFTKDVYIAGAKEDSKGVRTPLEIFFWPSPCYNVVIPPVT